MKIFLIFLLVLTPFCVVAGEQIDDSASQVLTPFVPMEWENPLAIKGGGDPNKLVGQTEVIVRLNSTPYVGKTGNIVLKLRHPANLQVRAQWIFRQGLLKSGTLRSGEQVSVYQGLIAQETMEDRMNLQLSVEGDPGQSYNQVEFYFEFEE